MEMSVAVGFALSIIAILPIALSGVMYLFKIPVAVKNMEHVGFSHMLAPFGVIKIVIAVMTLIPTTSFLGVILATGWMGGAIAAHIRIRENYVIQMILPIFIWVGFGLRHQAEMHALLGV
jgi:hypothetical protein